MRTDTPQPIFLKDYRSPAYLITDVTLDILLDRRETIVRSKLRVKPNPEFFGDNAPLALHGEDIELISISIDGTELSDDAYSIGKSNLKFVTVPQGAFTLEIETKCNPAANTQLSGLYISSDIFCTQCEAEGFRRITYFLDQPDILAIYTVRIEAEKKTNPILLSNGNLIESGDIPNSIRHFAVWHDPHPKPSYLFALVSGDLGVVKDQFTTMSGRIVDLAIYVEHGKQDLCWYALEALKRSMRWDEERFGREYDLDIFMIVAVSDFNMGAMENKGLNIFNDKFVLASQETATDADFANIEAIIAHEYFHNWTGNRITCRDWFQLCLKEGLTVYRDQEFSADMRSRAVVRINDVRHLRAHQFPEDAGPLAHPVRPASFIEINNFYTATVYQKGAELVRMIATIVGKAGFRAGMDLYFERHDGTASTVDEFLECFENATGKDLGQFSLWYNQAGTPEINYKTEFDAETKSMTLDISQHLAPTHGQPSKQAMHIPLRLALIAPDGNQFPLTNGQSDAIEDDILHLTSMSTRICFQDISEQPVVSMCRDFSAPVNIVSDATEEELLFLMRHDTDAFNRWEACQSYAMRLLKRSYHDLQSGRSFSFESEFSSALGEILVDEKLDAANRAVFFGLPGQTEIANTLKENVDPEHVKEVQIQFCRSISDQLKDLLTGLLEAKTGGSAYSPDAKSAGNRALRNSALSLLCVTGNESAAALAVRHLQSANNMTDTMSALAALTHMDCPEREIHLNAFFKKFADNPLVVDKWFTLQAISARQDTPEMVAFLTEHEAFSWHNPNRVRSLVGAFATMNPSAFHRKDGAGYRLVSEGVLKLDKINPQVAARLLGAFRSWRMLEPQRRKLAKTYLQTVAKTADISSDVIEIATKSLAEDD